MGACNNSSVAQLVESRTQKPKCMGSNHGVDKRLHCSWFSNEKNSNSQRIIAVQCRSSTQNRGENWENGKRERGAREWLETAGEGKSVFFPIN